MDAATLVEEEEAAEEQLGGGSPRNQTSQSTLESNQRKCVKLPRNLLQDVSHMRCISSIMEQNTKGK